MLIAFFTNSAPCSPIYAALALRSFPLCRKRGNGGRRRKTIQRHINQKACSLLQPLRASLYRSLPTRFVRAR